MGLRAPNSMFAAQRNRVQQQQQSQTQEEQDALKRRLASLGGLDSGSAIKIEQQQAEKAGQRTQGALNEVDLNEQAYQMQQEEAQKQRDFAAGESALGRNFAGSESALERRAREMSQGSAQQFAGSESALGRTAQADLAGRAITSTEKLAGNALASNETLTREGVASNEGIAKMSDATQRRAQDFAQKTGMDQIQSQELMQQRDMVNKTVIQTMANNVTLKGQTLQKTIADNQIASTEKIDAARNAYLTAKDSKDMALAQSNLKNELTMSMITNKAAVFQLAQDLEKNPKDIMDFIYDDIDSSFTIDKAGNPVISIRSDPYGFITPEYLASFSFSGGLTI